MNLATIIDTIKKYTQTPVANENMGEHILRSLEQYVNIDMSSFLATNYIQETIIHEGEQYNTITLPQGTMLFSGSFGDILHNFDFGRIQTSETPLIHLKYTTVFFSQTIYFSFLFNNFSNLCIYKAKRPIKLLLLLYPSKHVRHHLKHSTVANISKSTCKTLKQMASKINDTTISNTCNVYESQLPIYDPCLNINFRQKYKIDGYTAIPITDSFHSSGKGVRNRLIMLINMILLDTQHDATYKLRTLNYILTTISVGINCIFGAHEIALYPFHDYDDTTLQTIYNDLLTTKNESDIFGQVSKKNFDRIYPILQKNLIYELFDSVRTSFYSVPTESRYRVDHLTATNEHNMSQVAITKTMMENLPDQIYKTIQTRGSKLVYYWPSGSLCVVQQGELPFSSNIASIIPPGVKPYEQIYYPFRFLLNNSYFPQQVPLLRRILTGGSFITANFNKKAYKKLVKKYCNK